MAESAGNEIEVTPEMIEAGVMAFRSNQTDDPSRRQVQEAVKEIFLAMSHQRGPTKHGSDFVGKSHI